MFLLILSKRKRNEVERAKKKIRIFRESDGY